jgi:hypothetical protein
VIAMLFLAYSLAGPYMPGLLAHRGVSLHALANHQWITTEGVFGIALGVSTSFVFLFVLFGALLEQGRCRATISSSAFSLLGHLRGGPAKAAVVASALTGLISGSSIANVVTTGTFTIPMMKRVGFSAEKAGAVEVASSVNGQIMPPVMGAAAFLMVEYVGISLCRSHQACLRAGGHFLHRAGLYRSPGSAEAGMQGLPRRPPSPGCARLTGFGLRHRPHQRPMAVYYGIGWLKPALGDCRHLGDFAAAGGRLCGAAGSVRSNPAGVGRSQRAAHQLPETRRPCCLRPALPAAGGRAGLVPDGGALVARPVGLLGHRDAGVHPADPAAIARWLRTDGNFGAAIRRRLDDLVEGLIAGARNMIGIGIATATAGIIVGAVSQTGVGLVLADLVEILSMGNLLLMLILTALLSLILGMGLPTTANYIVVSSAAGAGHRDPGAAERADRAADRRAPVRLLLRHHGRCDAAGGLASFAAAAVSGAIRSRPGCGLLLQPAHRGAAVPVHLQHRSAADQRGLGCTAC